MKINGYVIGLLALESVVVLLLAFGQLLAALVVQACALAWLLATGRKM